MLKYHVNPATGNPGLCAATVSCPFGDLENDHYTSREAAQNAYEKSQDTFTKPKPAKKPVSFVMGTNQAVAVPAVMAADVASVTQLGSRGTMALIFRVTDHQGRSGELQAVRGETAGTFRARPGFGLGDRDFDELFSRDQANTFAAHLQRRTFVGHPEIDQDPATPGSVSSRAFRELISSMARDNYDLADRTVTVDELNGQVIVDAAARDDGIYLRASEPTLSNPGLTTAELSKKLTGVRGKVPVSISSGAWDNPTPVTFGRINPAGGVELSTKTN